MSYDNEQRRKEAEARRVERQLLKDTKIALMTLQGREEAEAEEERRKLIKKVTRGNRLKLIPVTRRCRYCLEVKLPSKAWVVRLDVVMCRSCYNNVREYTKQPFPAMGVVDWSLTCNGPYPVEGCKCRYCYLTRNKG